MSVRAFNRFLDAFIEVSFKDLESPSDLTWEAYHPQAKAAYEAERSQLRKGDKKGGPTEVTKGPPVSHKEPSKQVACDPPQTPNQDNDDPQDAEGGELAEEIEELSDHEDAEESQKKTPEPPAPDNRTIHQATLDAFQEEWRRTVFLEDPTNSLGILKAEGETDPVLREALEALEELKAICPSGTPTPAHLRPVNFIQSKLPNLIDLRVIVLERIPSVNYTTASSQTVADWSFFVVADETGSVVAAFQPQLPAKIQPRAAKCKTDGRQATMSDLLQPSDIVVLTAVKTISMFGSIMVTFSKQSNFYILGSFMMNYCVDFGPRNG